MEIQDNLSKAREIVFGWADTVQEDAYDAALKMAEWKDDILREEREKAIEKFNEYYDNHLSLSMSSRYAGMVFLVDKILGEDSRDRMHCLFVTMDSE